MPNNIYIHPSKSIGLSRRKNMRIGLLGGSFNPAHKGHIYISNTAIKFFNLNEVWWIISPQNPLKSDQIIPSLKERIDYSRKITVGNRIRVQSLEERFHTKYTYHTIKKILQCYPGSKFLWLMGADNLAQINLWHSWSKIFNLIPIAVFNREGYSKAVMNSVAAYFYKNNLYNKQNISKILSQKTPVWTFLRIRKHPSSSTKIRKNNKKDFFNL